MKHTASHLPDYPRPLLVRKDWTNLNGEWDFAFDGKNIGRAENYHLGFKPERKIVVPYVYQVPASGIGDPTMCEDIWYQRKLTLDPKPDTKILLHLEGCDYITQVWLNGVEIGTTTGGYHRLTFDLTKAAKKGDNTLVIAVHDDYSKEHPRGKQRWQSTDHGCWYIDTSGIYKTAWLETVYAAHIDNIKFTADLSGKVLADVSVDAAGKENLSLALTVTYAGKRVSECVKTVDFGTLGLEFTINKADLHLWNVGAPELYDVELTLSENGKTVDKVQSYFGVREIKTEKGKVLLNGKPLYQKLVLDQGYWPQTGLTAPSEKALEDDIKLMLDMGLNGCRKHEKVEDERFLYYADIYGYITWCEMPSVFALTEKAKRAIYSEWQQVVEQMKSHPCILCWVPFNESWGIEKVKSDKAVQAFVNSMYYATKALDNTRPVITNDGWEHTISDIISIHHYTQVGSELDEFLNTLEKCIAYPYAGHDRGAFCDGYEYKGQPIMLTEFGGTAFVKDAVGAKWGYGEGVKNETEYEARLHSLIAAVDGMPHMCGYCYTQLSDVYHEVNGLTDFERNSKIPCEQIKKITSESGR